MATQDDLFKQAEMLKYDPYRLIELNAKFYLQKQEYSKLKAEFSRLKKANIEVIYTITYK